MKVSTPLPIPTPDEKKHSAALVQQIRSEINKQEGSISFRQYMEMALYEPGLGYYVAGKRKLGQSGDFVTAPELSPLFSHCIASQCLQILKQLASENRGSILEFGAGSGTMAADILLHLEEKSCLPEHYLIIDLSPDLKEQQKTTLETRAPHLLSRVQWLTSLPDSFTGIILGNEVLDAMPVELFQLDGKTPYQQHVAWKDEQFALVNVPYDDSSQDYIAQLGITELDHQQSYLSEFNPNINPWVEQLENTLKQGIILLIDYGYTRQEYYHPDRNTGTLICHYQHLVHNDFFWHPGLQDITANVDFTHIAEAADKQRLFVAGFTSQATFLAGCGLEEHFIHALEQDTEQNPEQQYQLAQHIRTLSLPSEMGERFKVIALSKGLKEDEDLIGFSIADYRHKL